MTTGRTVPPLLFAAHGDRAERWAEVIRRSHQLELLAAIDLSAGGVEGLEAAIAARPDAAVAVWASGPLEATRIAERLVGHPGPSLLHPPPARPLPGHGVQLTHGWLTLSGIAAVERLLTSPVHRPELVWLRVQGAPERAGGGLGVALYHAATLAHRVGAEVHVEHAVLEDEQRLTVALEVDGLPWRLEVAATTGPSLSLGVRTSAGDFAWRADEVSERLERASAEPRVLPATPWAERCLRQLVTPVRGADLRDARSAHALVDSVELALERRLPPAPRPRTRRAGSMEAPPTNALLRLGLLGDLPDAAPLTPTPPPTARLPLEALAYQHALRPAVFLTVAPHDEARVRALLPGTIERRERRVDVSEGDRWRDDREVGEPMVELFAAREPATAAELAALQTQNPTEAASTIAALLGYPACCVQAFVAQADRADNSYNRYAIAARTGLGPAWPALLDDTALKLLPHFACTYRCERSREQAEALLAILRAEAPTLHRELEAYLAGPVLYFDHDHQLRFRGSADGAGIEYSRVAIPWSGTSPFAELAGAIAEGDRLVLTPDALTVRSRGAQLFSLRRTDPGLGVILPFASVAREGSSNGSAAT